MRLCSLVLPGLSPSCSLSHPVLVPPSCSAHPSARPCSYYSLLALSACPPASARAPYRAKNALLDALLAFVAGVFAYALAAVKQDTFDDLDDTVRRAAMSAEDERRAMQMAGKHATAGAGANVGAVKGAPRPARLREHARAGAAVRAPISMEKETPASTPRGVLPALLERRAPWLLDPTRKTLVRGEHSDSLWPPSSSPVFLDTRPS
ncbi:hypothetical protein FB451DRAFT_1152804 [Mycena latifolia]|nr:hypothetical protein FB451DRAFT_1152804 [Mycena latifolia]